MLIPKFSISQMLAAMAGLAIVSACLASAARGGVVAFGLSVALAGLIVPLVLATVLYWSSFSMAMMFQKPDRRSTKAPPQ